MQFQFKVFVARLKMFNLQLEAKKLIWWIGFKWKYRMNTPQWKGFQDNGWGSKFKRENAEAITSYEKMRLINKHKLPPIK